ncbi:MAG: PorT family protein [Bacteroidia bacterium]|jgi:hypothetical protein|nr:PorT family protein [Bacteroidia bacterium]
MKKIAILVTLFTTTIVAQAQMFDLGIKAGLNRGELTTKQTNLYAESASSVGFCGGAFARVGILGFFVQPELMFSQRKGAFQSTANQTAVIQSLNYIDVPVLIGYKLLFARVNFGPNFQFLAGAHQKAEGTAIDPNFNKENFKSSNIGFQAGIGFDLSKISLDVRYDGVFSNAGKKIVDAAGNTIDYSTRPSVIQFTIGFKFL